MRELLYIDKNCPHCGAHFNAGRRNKKFCSSKCRSGYHNGKNREVSLEQGRINQQLLKNYRILDEVLSDKRFNPLNVPMAVLTRKGFNPKLFTSHEEFNEEVKGAVRRIYNLAWTRNLVTGCCQLFRLTKDGRLAQSRKS